MLGYKFLVLDVSNLENSAAILKAEASNQWEIVTIVPKGDSHIALLKRLEQEEESVGEDPIGSLRPLLDKDVSLPGITLPNRESEDQK
jgi:hypothetical protein